MTTESHKQPGQPFWKISWVQNTLIVIATIGIAYGLAYYEVIRRAGLAYKEGDELYAKGEYRRALWSYQEVLDFYTKPRSRWVDMAQEKVKVCEEKLKDEDPIQALDKLLGIAPSAAPAPASK